MAGVDVRLTTHDAGGLTQKDIDLLPGRWTRGRSSAMTAKLRAYLATLPGATLSIQWGDDHV